MSRLARDILCVLAGSLVWGLSASATIDLPPDPDIPAKFTLDKTICDSDPTLYADPSACPLATQVVAGADVWYVITVGNPWGEPTQSISLSDPPPTGFTPAGAPVCRDAGSGAVVPQSPAWTFDLDLGATVHCVWKGKFSGSGARANTVEATNTTGYGVEAKVNTTVIAAQPSGVDLSLKKATSTPSVDVTSGAQVITYTLTLKNASPTGVDLGSFFTLHDRMSLLPDSVPLRVEFLSASCTATPGTDCLDTANVTTYGNPEILVGTAGQHNLASFRFPPGPGHIEPGGEITLTITARVRWLPGLTCVRDPSANGLRNFAFFSLVGPNGSALSESNAANNSGAANVKVTISGKTQDDECATGHLKIKKAQVDPNPNSKVAWGDPVTYEIKVANSSFPAQPITFDPDGLTDWVTEGINTPPFTRVHINTVCVSSNEPGFCAAFNSAHAPDPKANYTYYTQTLRAWTTTAPLTLGAGRDATFRSEMRYVEPDCETVPAAPNKPIINTARAEYEATEFGALSASDPKVKFSSSASATTRMEDQRPCDFKVTKSIKSKAPWIERVAFGEPVDYRVTFESNEPDRRIGTLLDRIRLQTTDYAASLAYESEWKCTDNGRVSGYEATGSINGTFGGASSPVRGSEAVRLRPSGSQGIVFETGGRLSCAVRVTFKRPPVGASLCMHDPRRFENAAMMDVTHPFNAGIYWQPSSNYSASALSNPKPQEENWATVTQELPRCMDATLNKSASVDGLPGTSKDWTYEGGPQIDYGLTLTNTTKSGVTGSGNFDGLQIDDRFDAPYAGITTSGDACSPASFCQAFSGGSGRRLGVANLNSGQDGVWTFAATGPFQAGQDVKNCARISEQGSADPANQLAYQNYVQPVDFEDASAQSDCVTVPIIRTTRFDITKVLVDNTGANLTQAGDFTFNVSCSPYDMFLSDNAVTIAAGQTGSVKNVPVRSNCTITEELPPVPQAAQDSCAAQGLIAQWHRDTPDFSQSSFAAPLSTAPIAVTATNRLVCTEGNATTIKILKRMGSGGKDPLSFDVQLDCNPGPVSPNPVTLSLPSTQPVTVTAQVGATCTMTEILPTQMPEYMKDYCQKNPIAGRGKKWAIYGVPLWRAPQYIPNQTFTVAPNMTLAIRNQWYCGTPTKKALGGGLGKVPVGTTGGDTTSGGGGTVGAGEVKVNKGTPGFGGLGLPKTPDLPGAPGEAQGGAPTPEPANAEPEKVEPEKVEPAPKRRFRLPFRRKED